MNLRDKIKADKVIKAKEDADYERERERKRLEVKRRRKKEVENLLYDVFREKVSITEANHSEDWHAFFYIPELDIFVTTARDDAQKVCLMQLGFPYNSRRIKRPSDFKLDF